MAGDSLMRDFFLTAVCLQSPHTAALPKMDGMHFGTDGVLTASNVLAKHDETYMPREVAESLRDKGVWQGEAN